MADQLPLIYKIPKVELNVRPKQDQSFKVSYGVYNESMGSADYWYQANNGNPCIIDKDGNISNLEFTNLAPNSTYIVRFIENSQGASYDFLFKTGRNIKLGDSPYYNKVLFPGQVYDWYIDVTDVGLPTLNECEGIFKLNGNKRLSGPRSQVDDENFGSLCTYNYVDGKLAPTVDVDPEYKLHTDKDGVSMNALYVNNDGSYSSAVLVGSSDFHQNESGRWVGWKYYWMNAGGGGILGSNLVCGDMGFCFCIDETVNKDVVILYADSEVTRNYKSTGKFFMIEFTKEGNLRVTAEGAHNYSEVFTSPFTLEKNKWYFLQQHFGGNIDIYSLQGSFNEDDNEKLPYIQQKFSMDISNDCTSNEDFYGKWHDVTFDDDGVTISPNTYPTYSVPCVFGNHNTKGVYIANLVLRPFRTIDIDTKDLIYKVLCPAMFSPRARLSGTTKTRVSWNYLLSAKFNSATSTEKISLLIDPDIFDKVPELKGVTPEEIGEVRLDLMVDGYAQYTTFLDGFYYPDPEDYSPIHVGALIDNAAYTTESYRLNFKEEEDPLKALSSYFFTKHGTWGGYNGGVNGHCMYFNGEGNLILECHGDYYGNSNSTLKNNHCEGVGKESLVKPYTGYGGTVDYINNTWDKRSNKLLARTGTALVSNKYYQYGRVDVTMKIPVGTWGVCPAIWLFHYIEVADGDFRYDIPPYNERNAQGSAEDGFYRVVNNEIDIELPSHLTNGVLPSWSDLAEAYFDTDILDDKVHIGLGKSLNSGLYRLNNPNNPYARESWSKVVEEFVWKPRIEPSFKNCKFNNWVGELNAGDGWCLPPDSKTSAMDYYYGTNEDYAGEKEEYCSMLTPLATNENGYADGQFHKWSIVWLPDKTVLLVDDKVYRVNKGFVPFNQMKLTIAMWFPTMAINKKGEGVIDRDGVHGIAGAAIGSTYNPLTDGKFIGTWAGTEAPFEVCHLEISEIAYEKYNVGDDIIIEGVGTTHIDSNPMCMGESFPESGLRTLE